MAVEIKNGKRQIVYDSNEFPGYYSITVLPFLSLFDALEWCVTNIGSSIDYKTSNCIWFPVGRIFHFKHESHHIKFSEYIGNWTNPIINSNSSEWYNKSGQLHRDDGPAYISAGTEKWYQNGVLHRSDGPAVVKNYSIIDDNKLKWVYLNNNNVSEWYNYGKLYKRINYRGIEEWLIDDKLHRVDGPAKIYPSGRGEWFINNKNITSKVNAWLKNNSIELPFTKEHQFEFIMRWG